MKRFLCVVLVLALVLLSGCSSKDEFTIDGQRVSLQEYLPYAISERIKYAEWPMADVQMLDPEQRFFAAAWATRHYMEYALGFTVRYEDFESEDFADLFMDIFDGVYNAISIWDSDGGARLKFVIEANSLGDSEWPSRYTTEVLYVD